MLELLALQPDWERQIADLTDEEASTVEYDWRLNGRPSQLVPGTPGAAIQRIDWNFWLILAGRGYGKTRTGGETVREWAEDPDERILIVGPTWTDDIENTMLDGPSGLMSCYPPNGRRPVYNSSSHEIIFPSGAVGITRSGSEPERLRGCQFRKFWIDELCAMQYSQEVWNQIMFGFRLPGARIQGLITTTPKPLNVLKALAKNPRTVLTTGSSYENRAHLSPEYYSEAIAPYVGTRLGRQEIFAEILEDVPGALWTRANIEANRIKPDAGGSYPIQWDKIERIVVGVDPAVTNRENSDETGIVVCALTLSHHVLVLADRSLRASTDTWARAVIEAYRYFRADRVIGEANQGGDLIEMALRTIDPSVSYKAVRATRGKAIRAEPVAALYEQGRVHHAGPGLETLEDQLCTWSPQVDTWSPDRLDALVWAITELLVDNSPATIQSTLANPYVIR